MAMLRRWNNRTRQFNDSFLRMRRQSFFLQRVKERLHTHKIVVVMAFGNAFSVNDYCQSFFKERKGKAGYTNSNGFWERILSE